MLRLILFFGGNKHLQLRVEDLGHGEEHLEF